MPLFCVCLLFLLGSIPRLLNAQPVHSFYTGGHVAYHVQPATVAPGERSIIAAAYDGGIFCYSRGGVLRWSSTVNRNFPYDLKIADLDGDGLDDVLVATGGGGLYVLDHTGKLRWTFQQEPPLFQVDVARLPDGQLRILTGGSARLLYVLDNQGRELKRLPVNGAIRLIGSGHLNGPNTSDITVVYARSDYGRYDMTVLDATTLQTTWEGNILTPEAQEANKRYQDLLVLDINNDGVEEIVCSGGRRAGGRNTQLLYAFNGRGEQVRTFQAPKNGTIYRMILLSHVSGPAVGDDYILGIFGDQILTFHLNGTARAVFTSRYSFTNGAYDPQTQTYILGSDQSGGDGIHLFDLTDPAWGRAFESLRPGGAIRQIEQNLAELRKQVERFQPPAYQPPPRETWIAVSTLQPGREYYHTLTPNGSIQFIEQYTWSERYDRSSLPFGWSTKVDERQRYNLTTEELAAKAREQEQEGADFGLWVGHGHDPFFLRLESLKEIVRNAPETFHVATFAELEARNDAMRYAVEEHIVPMARFFRQHGKKIFFKNKNIFWNGSAYDGFWKPVLLSGEFADVFVPSLEETNSRSGELSLSGRLGLWLTGVFDEWGSRPVADNATVTRFHEWAAQKLDSHFLRFEVYRAALGARYWLINRYQDFDGTYKEDQHAVFYMLLDRGIISPPKRDDLLSVSPVAVGLTDDLDDGYLDHGTNGHTMSGYDAQDGPYVFDRLDCYWAGASTAPWDFSRFAAGCGRRMTNFLPRFPWGQVAIMPQDTKLSKTPRFKRIIATDGRNWFDASGAPQTPSAYSPRVEAALQQAAEELPVRVSGDAAWVVRRLDPTHARVLLVDPGYVDPNDREAVIHVQHLKNARYRDILRQDDWKSVNGPVNITIPMGVFRVIDIEHGK